MQDQNGIITKNTDDGGMEISGMKNNNWIKIQGVDFGKKVPKDFSAKVSGLSPGTSLEVRVGSLDGKQIAKLVSTGDKTADLQIRAAKAEPIQGKQDLYLLISGGDPSTAIDIDWWRFQQR